MRFSILVIHITTVTSSSLPVSVIDGASIKGGSAGIISFLFPKDDDDYEEANFGPLLCLDVVLLPGSVCSSRHCLSSQGRISASPWRAARTVSSPAWTLPCLLMLP